MLTALGLKKKTLWVVVPSCPLHSPLISPLLFLPVTRDQKVYLSQSNDWIFMSWQGEFLIGKRFIIIVHAHTKANDLSKQA